MEGILLTRRKFKSPVIILITEAQPWHLNGVSVILSSALGQLPGSLSSISYCSSVELFSCLVSLSHFTCCVALIWFEANSALSAACLEA